MSAAKELLAVATPRPWRDAQTMGAIVSDDPAAIARRGEDNLRGYGGAVVCESAERSDRALILAAVNEYEALLEVEASLRAVADFLAGGPYRNHAKDALAHLDALREVTRDANAPSL